MEPTLNSIAVIIARAGSRELPNKAMAALDGRPLVAWTLEHALGCHALTAVVLTTDGPDIASVGRTHGVHVYDRPAELARDDVTIDAAARHGVLCWEAERGVLCDHVAIMYANVALRPVDLTDRALAQLQTTRADSVQSVCPVGKMHPLWMRTVGDDDTGNTDLLGMVTPNRVFRRQDLPPVYMLDAGALVVRRECLFAIDPNEPHAFLGTDRRALVTEPGDVVDVDSTFDLLSAETILAWKRRHGQFPSAGPRSTTPRIRATS